MKLTISIIVLLQTLYGFCLLFATPVLMASFKKKTKDRVEKM